ncbi:MAG: dihydroorotate dehydrogenase-like protein [Kiritimatiellales bacterium]|nr:dihydroorotate dehydrogenase-like protein [Kiritimatiellota bacterium]MBL7011578.1 dihydroorotate dehydrogenase-like protein [Kiritimatiellales bacterium]
MDLRTTYMGLTLKNPLVISSSPISASEEELQKAVDAGAAAVVMFSLFEEQITKPGAEHPYFPGGEDYAVSPDAYFDLLHKTVARHSIPIIGSLNGVTTDGWITYARNIQDAGAQGLELNIYNVAANPDMTGQEIERRHFDIVRAVKEAVDIPVALKLSPYFSSLGNMIHRLDHLGIDALVLFNRFYQPDFNLVAMEIEPSLALSGPEELRLPLRWIAMTQGTINASLGASTGVQSGAEVVKYLLAGADAVMTASALLQHGPAYVGALIRDLESWMKKNEYESISEFKGIMGQRGVPNPEEFERANYLKVIGRYMKNYLKTD